MDVKSNSRKTFSQFFISNYFRFFCICSIPILFLYILDFAAIDNGIASISSAVLENFLVTAYLGVIAIIIYTIDLIHPEYLVGIIMLIQIAFSGLKGIMEWTNDKEDFIKSNLINITYGIVTLAGLYGFLLLQSWMVSKIVNMPIGMLQDSILAYDSFGMFAINAVTLSMLLTLSLFWAYRLVVIIFGSAIHTIIPRNYKTMFSYMFGLVILELLLIFGIITAFVSGEYPLLLTLLMVSFPGLYIAQCVFQRDEHVTLSNIFKRKNIVESPLKERMGIKAKETIERNSVNQSHAASISLLRERGFRPFQDLNVEKYSVYSLGNVTLKTIEEHLKSVNKLYSLDIDIFSVPQIDNHSERVEDLVDKYSNHPDNLFKEYINHFREYAKDITEDKQITGTYVVVEKEKEDFLVSEINKLNYPTIRITENSAKDIEVAYLPHKEEDIEVEGITGYSNSNQ